MIIHLALLLQALPVQQFPTTPRPGMSADVMGRIQSACPSSVGRDRSALFKLEARFADSASSHEQLAGAWTALGCVRALLDIDTSLSHEGLLMVAGTSWAQGSMRAMLKALAIQPNNKLAADVLALVALGESDPEAEAQVAGVLRNAARAGVESPAVLRACSELALREGDDAGARACSTRALVLGFDSTWHNVRLARLSFRSADTVGGTSLFLRAIAAMHDSAARNEIEWHLQWFLSPEDVKTWPSVPDSARAHWIKDQLAMRDVRDGQPPGARLAEHFNRFEYVEAHFRLHVPRNQRERIRTDMAVHDDGSHSTPFTAYANGLNFCEAGDAFSRPWRDYKRWQVDFDDRGIVWMRFGAPDKEADFTGTSTLPDKKGNPCPLANITREIWRYDLGGTAMILTFEGEAFDGSIAATRLVTGAFGSYTCGIDIPRCLMTQRSNMGFRDGSIEVTASDVERLRKEDRQYISQATTQDDNSVRGDQSVEMVSNLHRLWDTETGAPIALVTYALKYNDLSVQKNGAERTAAVDLALRQWDPHAAAWSDTALSRHLLLPDTNLKRTHVTGFFIASSSAGVTSWSLVATQPDHRMGRVYDVSGTPLGTGPLVLSDLVLGADNQGLVWSNHGANVTLAPLDAVDRTKPVSLYYQLKSDAARPALTTTVALYEIKDGVARDTAAFQVAFESNAERGINEVAPTLDVTRLSKGSYRLEVRIADAAGTTTARRSVTLYLE